MRYRGVVGCMLMVGVSSLACVLGSCSNGRCTCGKTSDGARASIVAPKTLDIQAPSNRMLSNKEYLVVVTLDGKTTADSKYTVKYKVTHKTSGPPASKKDVFCDSSACPGYNPDEYTVGKDATGFEFKVKTTYFSDEYSIYISVRHSDGGNDAGEAAEAVPMIE